MLGSSWRVRVGVKQHPEVAGPSPSPESVTLLVGSVASLLKGDIPCTCCFPACIHPCGTLLVASLPK